MWFTLLWDSFSCAGPDLHPHCLWGVHVGYCGMIHPVKLTALSPQLTSQVFAVGLFKAYFWGTFKLSTQFLTVVSLCYSSPVCWTNSVIILSDWPASPISKLFTFMSLLLLDFTYKQAHTAAASLCLMMSLMSLRIMPFMFIHTVENEILVILRGKSKQSHLILTKPEVWSMDGEAVGWENLLSITGKNHLLLQDIPSHSASGTEIETSFSNSVESFGSMVRFNSLAKARSLNALETLGCCGLSWQLWHDNRQWRTLCI